MDEGDLMKEENRAPEISEEPAPEPMPPSREYVPPERKVNPLKWLVTSLVVIVVVLILIFAASYFLVSPLVGKWHITNVYVEGVGNTSVDFYLEFFPNGTGRAYGGSTLYGYEGNFTWKDIGGGRVRMGSGNSSKVMNYTVHGDKIELSYTDEMFGNEYLFHLQGTRVKS